MSPRGERCETRGQRTPALEAAPVNRLGRTGRLRSQGARRCATSIRGRGAPRAVGNHYFPHLTTGVAKFDDLKVIEAEPFEPSTVHAAGVAVYHLGNNGIARALLKEWPVTDS